MSDLLALAERVEAAKGADRELDYAVALGTGWHPPGIDERLFRHPEAGAVYAYRTPTYTASLDAAMTLASDPDFELYGGALGLLREALDRLYRNGSKADALARFLTAAALRARAAMKETSHVD